MFLKEDYEAQLDEAGIKRLDRIVFLCHRMERLVNDLLNFSRIGRQQLAIKSTDLNEVIADIKATMEAVLHDEHVEISVPEPLPTVVCDATRVTEVFRNLITNSIKYNKSEEKRIEIGAFAGSAPNGKTERVFFVRDNGIGIAPEFHIEIFRLFKRLNNEDQSVMGTGGGLTFVKKIVERHHGRIWVESAPGEGATFLFTLDDIEESSEHE
jgi:light-regulated signal transduction histidine kinase (bacteriophytochrome)